MTEAKPRHRKLNLRQEQFCREYMATMNATKAYLSAGYKSNNLVTAGTCAGKLLKNTQVAARLAELSQEKIFRSDLTLERISRELASLSFSDARNYFTWGPNGVTLRPSSELTDDQAACVSSVRQVITKDGGTIELKLWDKNSALEKAGKYLGMFHEVQRPAETAPPMVVFVLPQGSQVQEQPQTNGHAAIEANCQRVIDPKSQA